MSDNQEATSDKAFQVNAEQAVIFGARLRASIVGVQYLYTGSEIIVADRFADTATTIYNQGFALKPVELTTYSASKRYERETAGITISGMPVATDRNSQAMISGAWAIAQSDPDFTTKWKGTDGTFVELDATTITAVARAVGAHVAACFSKEADVAAGIAANTITTYAQIDAAFAAV